MARGLLVFDLAYSLRILRERGLEVFVTNRDLDGYFDRVVTVHPIASLPDAAFEATSRPVRRTELGPKHVMLEGAIGRFRIFERFPALNFAIAQLILFVAVIREARAAQVTVVRSEDPLFGGAWAVITSFVLRLPSLVGVFGNYDRIRRDTGQPVMPRLFKTVAREAAFERWVYRRIAQVVVASEENASGVMAMGVPRDRIAITSIGNAIHPAHAEPVETRRVRLRHPDASPEFAIRHLVCVSRLEPVKLVESALEAALLVLVQYPDLEMWFIGDGSLRSRMEARADSVGLAGRVRFLGNRDQQWIADALVTASAVLSPLTGRALIEAALAEAPIVGFDVDLQRDVIPTDSHGLLVPVGDVSGLADGVRRILDDPALATAMGRRARAHAESSAPHEAVLAQHRNVYEQLRRNR